MKKDPTAPARAALLAAALACAPAIAPAADYALIMGIGVYQEASANLPGIDKDVAIARRMAQSIGVPASNIRELTNGQVTRAGVTAALRDMESQLKSGDRAFIYYSGHGAQVPGSGGARCSEGMVSHDMQIYPDTELETAFARIATKAGQVIVFNDSCFSGGAATKATRSGNAVPKFFKSVKDNANYTCGDAVNIKSARNLVASAAEKGANFVYVAAAADDEVAMATPNGSAASVAWESCLRRPETDNNGSGALSAEELQRCAQQEVNRMGHKQTLTTIGNRSLPISFAAGGGGAASNGEVVSRSSATLEDIRQAASPTIQVELEANRQMVINRDELDLRVRSSRSGYLYLLHVGSDGRTFNLLFPNDLDQNNHVQGGSSIRLPRPNWRVKAGGPAGESHVLAIVAETPKQFQSLDQKQGPFKSASFAAQLQKTLRVEATGVGGSGGPGQFGASRVVSVREVQ